MNLLYCLRRANNTFGDHIAVRSDDVVLTYRELYQRVCNAARGLHSLGVRKGDRVAVLMLNSHRYFELYWACPMAGAIIVPLNIRWNLEELIYALEDSGSSVLVVDQHFEKIAAHLTGRLNGLRTCIFTGDAGRPRGSYARDSAARSLGTQSHDIVPDCQADAGQDQTLPGRIRCGRYHYQDY